MCENGGDERQMALCRDFAVVRLLAKRLRYSVIFFLHSSRLIEGNCFMCMAFVRCRTVLFIYVVGLPWIAYRKYIASYLFAGWRRLINGLMMVMTTVREKRRCAPTDRRLEYMFVQKFVVERIELFLLAFKKKLISLKNEKWCSFTIF